MLLLFVITFVIRVRQTKQKAPYLEKFGNSRASYYATLVDFIQNILSVIKLDAILFSK